MSKKQFPNHSLQNTVYKIQSQKHNFQNTMFLNENTWPEGANSALLSQGPNHPWNLTIVSNIGNGKKAKSAFLNSKNECRFSFIKCFNLQTSQTPLDFGQESQPEGLRRADCEWKYKIHGLHIQNTNTSILGKSRNQKGWGEGREEGEHKISISFNFTSPPQPTKCGG